MPVMSRRRAFALFLVLYLTLDFSSPFLPGAFFFGDDGLFIDTVIEGKTRPIRLRTEISTPRIVFIAHEMPTAVPVTPEMSTEGVVRERGRPRVRPSERSSLSPPSLDDH